MQLIEYILDYPIQVVLTLVVLFSLISCGKSITPIPDSIDIPPCYCVGTTVESLQQDTCSPCTMKPK